MLTPVDVIFPKVLSHTYAWEKFREIVSTHVNVSTRPSEAVWGSIFTSSIPGDPGIAVQAQMEEKHMSSKLLKMLGECGRKLWKERAERYEIDGIEPLLFELCQVADRLRAVRVDIATRGADPKLISCEVKLLGMYSRLWRQLGFSDSDVEPARVGYPEGIPRRPRRNA